MSSSDTENSVTNAKIRKKTKFVSHKMKTVKKWEKNEILVYVEKLHDLLKKNGRRLKKYKDKIKLLLKQVEQLKQVTINDKAAIAPVTAEQATTETQPETTELKISQTTFSNDIPSNKDTDIVIQNEEEEETSASAAAFSFVDEMRQAAEQAQNLSDFVYEPTSGLYYDHKTGYYYNAEYGLYYDGNTGCYYNFNKEKNAFEFHSQVQVQANQTATKASDDDDDDIFENYNDDVEFDEWGVITDRTKLKQIKKEKDKLKQERLNSRQLKNMKLKNQKRRHSAHKKSKKKHKRKRRHSSKTADSDSDVTERGSRQRDIEDGELSTSSSSDSNSSDSASEAKSNIPIFKSANRFQDIAKKYPPSLRIIVQETNLETLKVGSLSLITYKGGSLGREGNHDVIIPDVNVSKFHLKFDYDTKKSVYKCIDLGSRNGTVLNGTRMSTSKNESEAYDLVHGSILFIGQTKLLCHVHEGNSTCGLCEPGLLIETPRENVASATVATTVVLSHKEQLKKLQKKYGLENEKFVDGKQNSAGGGYNDRAATRRIQVGSSTDKEKTQTASVNTAISSENKGFKMLAKLGWSKGEALGKSNTSAGLLEPINVSSNEGKKGLGCEDPTAGLTLTVADKKKIETWKKTQARYQKADIFCENSDDST